MPSLESVSPRDLSVQETSLPLLPRLATFTFGVVSYVVGVTALVALILTLFGVFEFTGGPVGALSLPLSLGLNLALLVGFALQHSIMARPSFKARWTRVIPEAAERSCYVLATGIVLLPTLLLWQPMPTVIWSLSHPALVYGSYALAAAGWVYLLVASFAINHFELFGLQQVFQALRGRPLASTPFKERWMYRFDRHPIMTGVLVGLWVTPTMTLDHLLFATGFTIYVVIGVTFEERSLYRQWGAAYEEYASRVGSLVPSLYRLSKPR